MKLYTEEIVPMGDLNHYLRAEAKRGYEVVSIFPEETQYYKMPVNITETRPKSSLKESHKAVVMTVCVIMAKGD